MSRCWRKSSFSCWIHPAAQSSFGEQQWDSLVSQHSVGFQIKIGSPKFYDGEMITPAQELGTIVIQAWPSFLVWSPPCYCNKYLLCFKQTNISAQFFLDDPKDNILFIIQQCIDPSFFQYTHTLYFNTHVFCLICHLRSASFWKDTVFLCSKLSY